jgi:hypothetical protein
LSPSGFWATLGIDPTRERAEIRRAYARRLKETNPEDDPEGFQALRAAYERALAYAGPQQTPVDRESVTFETPDEDDAQVHRPRRRDLPQTPETDPQVSEAGERAVRRWRPADAPHRSSPSLRPHDWRAPDPILRPRVRRARTHTVRPDAADPDEQAYLAARLELQRRLEDPATPPAALQDALVALLALPALESVDRHDRAEVWLAGLIADNAPRSDGLAEAAIAYFHWDESRVGARANLGARVIARRDDLRFLASIRSASAPPQRAAAEALMSPPTPRRRRAYRLNPGLPRAVEALLATVRFQRPGVLASFDPAAVAWWDRYLSRPQLGPASLWTLMILPALLVLMRAGGSGVSVSVLTVTYVASLAAVGAVVLGRVYLVHWPRFIWRQRWAARAKPWARLGWAPGLIGVVLLSALVPRSFAAGLALGLAAVLAAFWALIVGDPDRRPGGRYSWQARSLFSFLYLAIFWIGAPAGLGKAAYLQMTTPVCAAAFGFVMGAGSLLQAWLRALSETARRYALGALGAAALAAGALLAVGWPPLVRSLAAALLVSVVLAHKTPAGVLVGDAYKVRHYAMSFGWLGWAIVVEAVHRSPVGGKGWLEIGGFWLLTGVAITVVASLPVSGWVKRFTRPRT